MGQHAILSASASKRWMNCTPSALLEKQFADEESIYAAEGTAAHALAEHKLKRFLKKRSKRPVSDYDCDEMEECTDDYVSFAMEQIEKAKQSCSDPVVMIEQRLDFSRWVPEGFGTGDLVIVADDTLWHNQQPGSDGECIFQRNGKVGHVFRRVRFDDKTHHGEDNECDNQ